MVYHTNRINQHNQEDNSITFPQKVSVSALELKTYPWFSKMFDSVLAPLAKHVQAYAHQYKTVAQVCAATHIFITTRAEPEIGHTLSDDFHLSNMMTLQLEHLARCGLLSCCTCRVYTAHTEPSTTSECPSLCNGFVCSPGAKVLTEILYTALEAPSTVKNFSKHIETLLLALPRSVPTTTAMHTKILLDLLVRLLLPVRYIMSDLPLHPSLPGVYNTSPHVTVGHWSDAVWFQLILPNMTLAGAKSWSDRSSLTAQLTQACCLSASLLTAYLFEQTQGIRSHTWLCVNVHNNCWKQVNRLLACWKGETPSTPPHIP
jgi:hypothetical protein